MTPIVGIIANPVSARDIRRVVANASSLQIADRANILLRVLAALAACGVSQVLMMPERGGIAGHVLRGIARARLQGGHFPAVSWLDMPVTGTAEDSRCAAQLMCKAGAAAIVVLGGDGTHRAVVSQCGSVPIAGISTGTNNAFPEHREPTITGLAAGLAATGQVPRATALVANKILEVAVGGSTDIALVDVAFVTDGYVGARAVWRMDTLRELFVTFADPEVIGLAAIAGLIEPVSRRQSGGLMVRFAPVTTAPTVLHAPIAPGVIAPVGIDDWRLMPARVPFAPTLRSGSIALDGERELSFAAHDEVSVTLRDGAFHTIDVAAVMKFAALGGLLRQAVPAPAASFA
ncbi:ATP-NAD kinase family protein [Bradyrhizobium sp. 2TAF24]|uniref:ATP-NAD kinase family protein n=1 Tax=Bradyrhizobium sp. 2TAF24 TaxID=3233011 RepID=UPI003F91D6AA